MDVSASALLATTRILDIGLSPPAQGLRLQRAKSSVAIRATLSGIFAPDCCTQGNTEMVELLDLKTFVEVLDSSGFSRAARRLGMSKSMVSRRIARMEAELGTPLLNRTTRGISPTEAGLEFKMRSER